jgi:hypothetical protein
MAEPLSRETQIKRHYMDGLDEDAIPPVIRILLDEELPTNGDATKTVRRLKQLSKELKAQAEWTLANFEYFESKDSKPGKLIAVTSGGLDPLSTQGTCQDVLCRLKGAQTIARTLGLYADVVLVPDHITTHFNRHWRGDNRDILALLTQMMVVQVLGPMIRSGIVRFWSGLTTVCSDCRDHLDEKITESAQDLLGRRKIKAELKGSVLCVDVSDLFGSSVVFRRELTESQRRKLKSGTSRQSLARETYLQAAMQALHITFIDLKHAEVAGGCLFSTARQPLRALHAFDSAAPALSRVSAWESARSVELPWVQNLSVRQVVQLREEAAIALPAFRETFVSKVATAQGDVPKLAETIQLLREEASAVSRELSTATSKQERIFRGTYGILGMAAAIYAAAGTEAVAGTLGLLSVLGLLHQTNEGPHKTIATAKSSPGYVLVKAKQLVEHAKDA